MSEKMNDIQEVANAMNDVANSMIPGRAIITVKRQDGVEKWAYNDVHFEVQKFLDRIRQNEHLDTFVTRKDSDDAMMLEVGFSTHDSMGAIVRELTQKASGICKRHGINTMLVAVDEGLMNELQAALAVKQAAMVLEAGTATRVVEGEGWTEKEALDDAMRRDEAEYGHGEGYGGGYGSMRGVVRTKMVRKPQRAKRVKIEKAAVRKGPVKKAYVISKVWGFSRETASPVERDRRFTKQYETQTDALKAARDLVLEYGEELRIELKAFCVGDTQLATLKPVGGQTGIWRFEVEFRE